MQDKLIVNLSQEEEIRATVPDINYIPAYKVAEEQRRANENERIANENERIELYEDMIQKVENDYFKGEKGDTGERGPQGEAYEITEEDYEEIENQVKTDIQPILEEVKDNSETAISIAKGANQSLTYQDYSEMVTIFNSLDKDKYKVGQNILIVTLNVPDLWISAIEETAFPYMYSNDDIFISELQATGRVQVGHYILSALETQKVDLTEYVKNTDYATTSKAGLIKLYSNYGTSVVNGELLACQTKTYAQYKIISPNLFVGKGTLENIFDARFVTLTQAEYDALETKDEDAYYNIVEE